MERMMRDRILYGIGCSKSLHSFEKDAFVACGRIKRHELFGAINWNTKVPEDGVGDIVSANVFQGVFTLFAKKAFRELMQLGTFNRPHSSTGGPSIEQSFVIGSNHRWLHFAFGKVQPVGCPIDCMSNRNAKIKSAHAFAKAFNHSPPFGGKILRTKGSIKLDAQLRTR